MARFQRNRVVDAFDRAGEQYAGAGSGGDFRADAGDDVGLEDERGDGRDEHGDGEHLQRRHAAGDEEEREDRNDEQPGRDVEFRRKDGGVKLGLDRTASGVRQAQDREDDEGDGHGRDRRDHHVADVREQRDLIDGRGHHGRVRQRGDLVAEVGAGDDGAGDHAVGETLGPADAQEGDADGGDGGPRAARHHGDDGADDAGRQEEHLGTDDLNPVVDEGRDHAAHGPGARNRADEEEDERRAGDVRKVLADGLLEVLPGGLEKGRGEEDAHAGRGEQGHLARAQDGVAAENADVDGQQRNQDEDRNEGDERPDGGFFHDSFVLLQAKIRKNAYL